MGVFRTFLALAVASSHTGLNIIGIMPFGALAVRSFFMVSGFYMYMILDTKYLKLPDGTRLFYTNRMWRLYPSYLVVLILSFLAMVVTGTTTMRIWSAPASEFWSALATLRPSSLFLIIMSNVFMVFANYVITAKYVPDGSLIDGIGAPGAQPCHYLLLNPPVWTLGVELAFYVMVPFLVRFGLGMTVGAAIVLHYFPLQTWSDAATWQQAVWYLKLLLIPDQLNFFVAGMLAYRIYKAMGNRVFVRPLGFAATGLLAFATAAYCFLTAEYPADEACKAYLFIVWLAIPFLFALTKSSKVDRWIGELSYPVYLTHFLVFKMLDWCLGTHLHPLLYCSVLIVASLSLIYFLERPIERIRQRRLEQATASSPTQTRFISVHKSAA